MTSRGELKGWDRQEEKLWRKGAGISKYNRDKERFKREGAKISWKGYVRRGAGMRGKSNRIEHELA